MLPREILLPEKFYEGIKQFNRQEFFEAHETLEDVWHERQTPDRVFIQGIIQIAAGCHHMRNGNMQGALWLFKRGLSKLEPFKPCYGKIDVDGLISSTLKLKNHKQDSITWPKISACEN